MGSLELGCSRVEVKQSLQHEDEENSHSPAIRAHPLGVRPSGNALTASHNLRNALGTMKVLSDEMLTVLLEWLDPSSLLALASTCRALYAYSMNEEIWRNLFIATPPSTISWNGSWRETVLRKQTGSRSRVDCSNLFSDALHRPHLCSQINLTPYASAIPKRNQIARLPDLSASEFTEKWTYTPFVLTDVVTKWPVYRDWSEDALIAQYGDIAFRAEAVDWPMRTYLEYMNSTLDESPLYLFDRAFVEKMDIKVGHDGAYWPPDCFGEDFFQLLGSQRPDSRWLIIGPKRSGSTFHKDPNATSAWNAVLKGSKYWIMFPASTLPPGVYVSADQSEVTSPLSIAEWLLTFHAEARQTPGCIEGVCYEGEVLHVPSGWWHLVVNLEPAIAITQNFIPRAHLKPALRFLKDKANQVSGFSKDVADPYALFYQILQNEHPDLLEAVDAAADRKRKWEDVVQDGVGNDDSAATGFSFGFGEDEDDIEAEIP